MTAKPRILHVSADIPDPVVRQKTKAVSDLIALTSGECANSTISLNRISPKGVRLVADLLSFSARSRVVDRVQTEFGEAWRYAAPPKGILHQASLIRLGRDLAEFITRNSLPDLLVGHKLSVEGIAVANAARMLDLPYGLTIQGDTDTKILAARPDLHGELSKVFHGAEIVVSFAPWSLQQVEAALGRRKGITKVIPCPTELDQTLQPRESEDGFLSVFHLDSYRRKNLRCLVEATEMVRASNPDVRLRVFGTGSERSRAAVEKIAKAEFGTLLCGAAERQQVRELMNSAVAFVLPSKRESFGLVFVEALFAGCPIIYPRDRAVDGFFDSLDFAIRVNPRDPTEVASAMVFARENEQSLKQALRSWQEHGGLAGFTREHIGTAYADLLISASLQRMPHEALSNSPALMHSGLQKQETEYG